MPARNVQHLHPLSRFILHRRQSIPHVRHVPLCRCKVFFELIEIHYIFQKVNSIHCVDVVDVDVDVDADADACSRARNCLSRLDMTGGLHAQS